MVYLGPHSPLCPLYVCVCMYIYVCIYMYAYIYIHTQKLNAFKGKILSNQNKRLMVS